MTGFYRKGQMGSSASFGGSGNAGGGATDRLYNTQFYNGNESSRTITTGMDLTSSGGMVMLKSTTSSQGWGFFDTERGPTKLLQPHVISQEETQSNSLTGFTSTGFTLGSYGNFNSNNQHYMAYTFKKAEKFFDVVTYTGNGSNRTISHSLNCVPGMIWVKKRLGSDYNYGNWKVYHRFADASASNSGNFSSNLDTTDAFVNTDSTVWNNTMATTTQFSVGTNIAVNQLNSTYVAYLFAHDTSASSKIKMGYWNISHGSIQSPTTFGWEADFCMVKRKETADRWFVFDYDRGWGLENSAVHWFDQSTGSTTYDDSDLVFAPVGNGFYEESAKSVAHLFNNGNYGSGNMLFMAIKKELDNVGTASGTLTSSDTGAKTVFYPSQGVSGAGVAYKNAELTRTPDVDMAWDISNSSSGSNWGNRSRPLGSGSLAVNNNMSSGYNANYRWGVKTFNSDNLGQGYGTNLSNQYKGFFWKRAKGFCDVVTYIGDNNSSKTLSHKLNAVPSMIWVKAYFNPGITYPYVPTDNGWMIWSNQLTNNTYSLKLDGTAETANRPDNNNNTSAWNNTAPTSTEFTVGNYMGVNYGQIFFIAYLFGDVAGVSKIGKYTGAGGTNQVTVDCGFSNGIDQVIIKKLSSTGEWFIFNRKLGITTSAGNDGVFSYNSSPALLATSGDMIEQTTSGFKITGNSPAAVNASSATYLFYAIAKTS